MSNSLAIATVTATLQTLLTEAVAASVPGSSVDVARPDGSENGPAGPLVSIYLYHVTPNAAWRNNDLPTRNRHGNLIARPRIALDLHYLLSFYGDEAEYVPQRLLGSVVSILHARPILSRDQIDDVVSATPTLAGSDLSSEVESVKFVPLTLTLEEQSRLWSVFFQSPHVLSLPFLATTVLIEADEPTQNPLPVRVRVIDVHPLAPARIDEVSPSYFELGDIVTIQGQHLGSGVPTVWMNEAEIVPDSVTASEIRFTASGVDLHPGVQRLSVAYDSGVRTNSDMVALRPRIGEDGGGNPLIQVSDFAVDPQTGVRSATLTVTVEPDVAARQEAMLLLNELPPSGNSPRSYGFRAEFLEADSATVTFRTSGFEAGNYLARLQVDRIDSTLDFDEATQVYSGPSVTLP